jgi:hypothetical protein
MNKIDFFSALNKGVGTNVFTTTIPQMRKTNNPFVGRVQKLTMYSGVVLGTNYENSVNACAERSGSTETFISEKPMGKHYINPFLLASDKDESVLYLQIQYTEAMLQKGIVKIHSIFLLDGKEATEKEVEAIKQFIPTKVAPKKQLEVGVDLDKVRYYIAPKLSNVVALKQGGAIWDELGLLS